MRDAGPHKRLFDTAEGDIQNHRCGGNESDGCPVNARVATRPLQTIMVAGGDSSGLIMMAMSGQAMPMLGMFVLRVDVRVQRRGETSDLEYRGDQT